MYRYQILIEYVGTSFVGWQIQKNGLSIQEILEKVLSKFLKEKIKVYGSGRTDAGVHASEQSAHFKTKYKNIGSGNGSGEVFILPHIFCLFLGGNNKVFSRRGIRKRHVLFLFFLGSGVSLFVFFIRNTSKKKEERTISSWQVVRFSLLLMTTCRFLPFFL